MARAEKAVKAPRARARHVDIVGEVLEVDVRQGRCQVWPDKHTCFTVPFSAEQEWTVMGALTGRDVYRLHVVGRAEFSPSGRSARVTEVEELTRELAEVPYDPNARPIEEVLMEIAAQVPDEEWAKLPPDLADQHDHYIYGTPKR
jgi:hypothetical protein